LVATDYIETGASTAQAGILEDMPRLDYSGGASCPSLLLEPQRSNLVTQSEVFNIDSSWFSSGRPVAETNATTSPEGLLNASKLTFAPTHTLRNASELTFTNGYSYSIFVKKDIGRYVTIFAAFFTTTAIIGFDLDEGTCQEGGVIEPYGDGWYRISVSKSVAGDADKSGYFYLYSTDSLGSTTSVGGNQLYVYGAQIEEGSYPTSYIPTYGSSVTRSGDRGTTNMDSIINDSEGVLFLDYTANDITSAYPVDFQLQFNGTNSVNGVTIYQQGSTPSVAVRSGSTQVFYAALTPTSVGGRNKIALAYKANDFVVYQNGVKKAEDFSGAAPVSLNEIRISDGTRNFSINQALLFNTRLTNAELAALTTL